MQLSIIIPVYNAGQTLGKCVDSVLSDPFRDYEVILVDDGSTDSSPQLCDNYATMDVRISVIHKEHKGVSDARNVGIAAAQGTYITFIDSDDNVEMGTFSELITILGAHPKYDLLEYPVYVYYGSKAKERLLTFQNREYTDMEEVWFKGKEYLHTYNCNKIYRRKLFKHVKFPVGKVFEDPFTIPDILMECETIATTSNGLYYYNYNEKSITNTASGKELGDLLNAHVRLVGTKFSPLRSAEYYARVLNIQLDMYNLTGKEPILPPLPAGINDKLTLKLILSKLLGIKGLCQLNKQIYKRRNRQRH